MNRTLEAGSQSPEHHSNHICERTGAAVYSQAVTAKEHYLLC